MQTVSKEAKSSVPCHIHVILWPRTTPGLIFSFALFRGSIHLWRLKVGLFFSHQKQREASSFLFFMAI